MTEVAVRSILPQLGFVEVWYATNDEPSVFALDIGVAWLSATQATSRFIRPIFLVSGVVRTKKAMAEIHIEMPLKVESFEQGIAWLAYGIGSALPSHLSPAWLEEGRKRRSLLPWVREQASFEARPLCFVERNWFRVASKKLREMANTVQDDKLATLSFDGSILRVDAESVVVPMPAKGEAWAENYQILLRHLQSLPHRLGKQSISFAIWDGHLMIAGRRLPVAPVQEDGR